MAKNDNTYQSWRDEQIANARTDSFGQPPEQTDSPVTTGNAASELEPAKPAKTAAKKTSHK